MSKKILLFLSDYKSTSQNSDYKCPDGTLVSGIQSNDAPCKYLLNHYSDITGIICLVTNEAEENAFQPFENEMRQCSGSVKVEKISFKGEDTQEFIDTTVAEIQTLIQEGDEILLDTTGGFRNAVMYLLLISRVLSYTGIETVGAVYSNYQKKRIEDLSYLTGMFDLVGGMQELSSFGIVKNIRVYYERLGMMAQDPTIEMLFHTVEELMESISLCRTGQIDQRMENFKMALENAKTCSDPMMRQLLPAFRQKFGSELTILSLINWCVESGMIQQALTIYTERVPGLIMSEKLIEMDDSVEKLPVKEYEDPNAVYFLKGFLGLSQTSQDKEIVSSEIQFKNFVRTNQSQINMLLNGMNVQLDQNIELPVKNMVLLLKLIYPSGMEGYDRAWVSKLDKKKSGLKQMKDWLTNTIPKDRGKMINRFAGIPRSDFFVLMERDPEEIAVVSDKVNPAVLTLKHMDKLLPNSGYHIHCRIEEIKQISRDYIYIKSLRNLANHANHEETNGQKMLVEYLAEYDYQPMEELSLQQLGQVIQEGIKHIEEIVRKEE